MMQKTPLVTEKDANGIPLDLGNRHHRRLLAKGVSPDAHEKFEKEPVWIAMERVMKHMKAWYALNMNWLMQDDQAKGTLESMRKDHEKREEDIRTKVAEAREAEHRHIDKVFARVEDQKILKNQLKSMEEEWMFLQKIATIRTNIANSKK